VGNAGGFPIFWLPGKSRLASSYRVIYGDSDVVVPKRHGEWLAENVPGAEVVVLAGRV
jgi:pimeloyl-ACP methyl ester carboxylesterase